MKQRLSYFDLRIITNELQSQIVNYRLNNIYDILNSNSFLLRFAIPDSKRLLIINPGFQIHLTDFSRDTAPSPSNFVTKLRKHLRTRRLTRVALANNDRILIFSFSDNYSFHLVFEFFSGGNMILLDENFRIMALLKTLSAEKSQLAPTEKYAVGSIYEVNSLLTSEEKDHVISTSEVKEWLANIDTGNALPKKKKEKSLMLRNFLYVKLPQLSSSLLEESLIKFNLDPTQLVTTLETSEDTLELIADAINNSFEAARTLLSAAQTTGYIVADKNKAFQGEPSEDKEFLDPIPITQAGTFVDPRQMEYIYTDYQPYKPTTSGKLIKLPSFNSTIDYYYSTIEASKASIKVLNKEQALERRLQAARNEKNKRLEGLTEVQERSHRLGLALQTHSDRVEEAAAAVRDLLEQKKDWKDIEQLIKAEQSRKNPVAQLIALPLDLKENKIKVILPDPDFLGEDESESESDSESESESESDSDSDVKPSKKNSKPSRTVKVEIDLALSAWANSRTYFEVKKSAAAKQERTMKSANVALKSAEKKIKRDIEASRAQDNKSHGLRSIREAFWFEKFYWFVSSDGYLVLGGHDLMQNQLLFRRYFKPHDVLVHADVPGASIVIIKNHLHETVPEVLPSTISQAGAFAAASSTKAWEAKMIPRSWYGRYDQIDKVTKDGQLVPIDNIEVKGGRNIIPPMPMDMGLGFMWLLRDGDGEEHDDDGSELGSELASGTVSEVPSQATSVFESEDNKGSVEDQEGNSGANASDNSDSALGPNSDSDPDSDSDSDSDSDYDFLPDTKIPDAIASGIADLDVESDAELTPDVVQETKSETVTPGSSTSATEGSTAPVQPTDTGSSTPSSVAVTGASDGKKRLSAKERRDLRKKRNQSSPEQDDSDAEPSQVVIDIQKRMEMLSGGKKNNEGTSQQPPKVRGKKGKLKKIATKYADQDEEERQEKLEKLGTIKSANSGLNKREKEQETRERQKFHEKLRKERQKKAEEAELKKILDFDENEDLSSLKLPTQVFVKKLKPGDVPVAAVPTFGPWGAITKLKYKIKFQSGTTKRGKAIKDIIHAIGMAKLDETAQDPDYAWPVEINLIKALKPTEISMPIAVSKVSFHLPNVVGGSNNDRKGGGNGSAKGGSGKRGGGKGGKRR